MELSNSPDRYTVCSTKKFKEKNIIKLKRFSSNDSAVMVAKMELKKLNERERWKLEKVLNIINKSSVVDR